MKKLMIPLALLALLAAVMLAGCGSKEAGAQTCAACGMEVAADAGVTVEGKVYCQHCGESVQKAVEATAVHDCDGGCGMTNVPEVQLTQVDGKWYCKGCMAKMEAGEEAGHEGHDH